jgi:lycopene beta-cyclase
MPERHDLLIAGGGVSGLSLAAHLARGLPGARVLVVDRNPRDLEHRNLSYWSRAPTLFDGAARGAWRALDVRVGGYARRCPLGEYCYRSLRGQDFAAAARDMLAAAPDVELMEGDVEAISEDDRGAVLTVGGRRARGDFLFDGRLLPDDVRQRPGSLLLRQHFLGWEIETDEDRFDPAAPTFLDFRVEQRDAVRFFYVLPFSPRRALVELVVHGAEPQPAQLRAHLDRALGVTDYRVVDVESGVSALTSRRHPRRLGRRIMAIGVHGGRLNASTGYAFTRIQRDSEAIVASLRRRGHPFGVPGDRRLFRLLDTLLLRVMSARPPFIEQAFEAMFRGSPIARVLRFLDEEASLWEVARLAARMPPGPFLGQLVRWLVGAPP